MCLVFWIESCLRANSRILTKFLWRLMQVFWQYTWWSFLIRNTKLLLLHQIYNKFKENERSLPRKIKCRKCIWKIHTEVQKPHKIRVCLRRSFMLIHVVFALSILSDMVEQKAAQGLLYFRMFLFFTKNINIISIFIEVGVFLWLIVIVSKQK